jgi:hypothetical protein
VTELYVIAALAVAGGTFFVWRRATQVRRWAEAASEDTCLLCGSNDVDERPTNDAYRCRACGFDTDLTGRDDLGTVLHELGRLAFAIRQLELARAAMVRAATPSVATFTIREHRDHRREHLDSAHAALGEAHVAMQEVKDLYETFSENVPDIPASPWREVADFVAPDFALLAVGTTAKSIRELDGFLAEMEAHLERRRALAKDRVLAATRG